MSFSKLCHFVLLCCFFIFSCLSASERELLQSKDINKIMKQIFDQHVDKKEMSSSILKNSFKVYIDQFDPNRTYLLEAEVKPFLQLQNSEVSHFVDQYQHSQFPEYMKLNDVIQNSIKKSREIRTFLEKDVSQLFQKSEELTSNGSEDWSDPDLKQSFAKNDKELENRIRNELLQFIAGEKKRFGNEYISARKVQTIHLYERQARSHENQYLFISDNGQPMNNAEKQNAFAMHVLKSLANSLDAHTTVLNPTEAYDMRVRLEKELQGIGVALQPTANGFLITQIIKNGPAAKSNLIRTNDVLVEIEGANVNSMDLGQVMEKLRGKSGSKVNITLKRVIVEGGKPVEKTVNVPLIREEVAVDEDRAHWSYEKINGGIIGKIQLNSFYQSDNGITSENDVREAIKQLDKQGNLRGLILDLRENSGGFLSQAVKVAGLFITNGVVVISKYFNGEEHFYRDMDGKVSYDGPLIILTSKATASAAEIVAQALQDYGVAIIVGDEHTYGKGTIQSQTVTENGASTFFKVTVGKYYTVSGKTPQIQGVKADIVVPSQFVHENLGEEYLDYPLTQDTISPAYDDSLADITPNLKSWYMRYYAPTLQHKKLLWENMVPQLKKNSELRISRNNDYQSFIKGTTSGKHINPSDMQLVEATAILKDMINLQVQMRGNEFELRGSSAQTVGLTHEKPHQ
jgi:carboxyl-terminal processing protease